MHLHRARHAPQRTRRSERAKRRPPPRRAAWPRGSRPRDGFGNRAPQAARRAPPTLLVASHVTPCVRRAASASPRDDVVVALPRAAGRPAAPVDAPPRAGGACGGWSAAQHQGGAAAEHGHRGARRRVNARARCVVVARHGAWARANTKQRGRPSGRLAPDARRRCVVARAVLADGTLVYSFAPDVSRGAPGSSKKGAAPPGGSATRRHVHFVGVNAPGGALLARIALALVRDAALVAAPSALPRPALEAVPLSQWRERKK